MQAAGKDAVHILDLLFGPKYTKDQERARGYQTEQEMWKKRIRDQRKIESFVVRLLNIIVLETGSIFFIPLI